MEVSEPSASSSSGAAAQKKDRASEEAEDNESNDNADDVEELMDVSDLGDDGNLEDISYLDGDGGDGQNDGDEDEDGGNDDDTVDDDAVNDAEEDGDGVEAEGTVRKDTKSAPRKSHPPQDLFGEFEFVRQDSASETEVISDVHMQEMSPQAGAWVDADKVNTAVVNKHSKFVCVDYPGVIENTDKAIATLGGMDGLSKVLSENLKMELAFRPRDPFCKPTIGSYSATSNLLVKVRRRPKVIQDAAGTSSSASSSGDGFEYQLEVLGIVHKLYSFDKFCDFQYLPVARQPDGQYQEILSKIRPSMSDDRYEFLSRKTPLFLPPFSFSRREVPANYTFDPEVVPAGEEQNADVIGLDRKKRNLCAIHVMFDHPGVPSTPSREAQLNMRKLPQTNEERSLEALKKLFEIRPLWNKPGILANLDSCHHRYLHILLPMVSFYFTNGPWRNLWCKLGYDPRKHPSAKIYQTVDYRVRTVANKHKVESKRGLELFRYNQFGLKQETSATLVQTDNSTDKSETGARNSSQPPVDVNYIFIPDFVPPYRQMRYQVCDVRLEEVQRKIHENDGQETTCTERDGWCVPDFTDVCRDLISATVDKLLTK